MLGYAVVQYDPLSHGYTDCTKYPVGDAMAAAGREKRDYGGCWKGGTHDAVTSESSLIHTDQLSLTIQYIMSGGDDSKKSEVPVAAEYRS